MQLEVGTRMDTPVGLTILLVEDDRLLLSATARLLSAMGHRPLPCACPVEALARAESYPGRIDVLLTDVVMPTMNGPELSRRFLEGRPTAGCILTSGSPLSPGDGGAGLTFLRKPFSRAQLAGVLAVLAAR